MSAVVPLRSEAAEPANYRSAVSPKAAYALVNELLKLTVNLNANRHRNTAIRAAVQFSRPVIRVEDSVGERS